MADTPNYNEASASGTCWQRASRVVIENPYQGQPYLTIVEEKVYNLNGTVLKENCSNLGLSMDPSNPIHLELYMKLNELYILLREERDGINTATITTDPTTGSN